MASELMPEYGKTPLGSFVTYNFHENGERTYAKIKPKSIRNTPKWCLERCGRDLWARSVPGAAFWSTILVFGRPFCPTWLIFGAIWGSLKIRGAPKTARKIEYGDFLARGGDQKAAKSRFGRCLEKARKFDEKTTRK